MKIFRYRSSANVPYDRQGLIWFTIRNYAELPDEKKRMVEKTCKAAAGRNWRALLEYMTSEKSAKEVAKEHYIASETTIHRAMRRIMETSPDDIL